jgi:hypothetical protein
MPTMKSAKIPRLASVNSVAVEELELPPSGIDRPWKTRARYVGPTSCEEEQVKSLSLALKDMMRKELLNAKENP